MTSKAKSESSLSPRRPRNSPSLQTGKKKESARAKSARNRTQTIKVAMQDALREKFKGAEYIRQLQICADDLEKLQASMALVRKKRLTTKDKEKIALLRVTLDIHNSELAVIKVRIDLNIKRLKFVLPELRSVTVEDPDGNNPLAVLGTALSQLTKSLNET